MAKVKIPKRISTALINSLGAGVVPRIGLEYIAVGRKEEISTLLHDLENISEGGATFRFIVGRYGSGKSFMLQLLRNYAMERNFVVADVDLSPERRFAGSQKQGVGTYRELMRNMATKTRPDGGALSAILERWISNIQSQVMKETGLRPDDAQFVDLVQVKIMDVIHDMEGMVHGFDFATILSTYWQGYRLGDDDKKDHALRWLRAEYTTKTEALKALKVRVIIDDDSWYDYIKLMARFVADIGYKGLLVLIDEAVNLYKISHTIARQNNYEKLLTMFNDTMQGKAEYLGILMGGTPQFVEDPRRGLYSYEALRSRLAESRFTKTNLRNLAGPIIPMYTLIHEEIFVLLNRLAEIHAIHYNYEPYLIDQDFQDFIQEILNRLGTEELLTPREVIRDFITVLDLIRQNPDISFQQLIHGDHFQPTQPGKDPNLSEDSEFAEFTI